MCAYLNVDHHWFNSYHVIWTQSVKTTTSKKLSVTQNSILGPILPNDMAEYITTCALVQYADDAIYSQRSLENLN